MKEAVLEAEARSAAKRSDLKTLRTKGMIPAVFYGKKDEAITLAVPLKKFNEILHTGGANVLVSLKLKDATKTAIIKEIQRDMITQVPIHIDFQAVSLKEVVQVAVPLHVVGVAPGVKLSGGILQHLMRELVIKCLPTQIPQKIDIDISALQIGNVITVKDLPKIQDVEIIADPNQIIVNVVAPAAEEEKPAAEAAVAGAAPASAEPEVISKGKKEKEEGAAPAAGEKIPPAAAGSAPQKK